jgi:iron complex outermembrane receptor protein
LLLILPLAACVAANAQDSADPGVLREDKLVVEAGRPSGEAPATPQGPFNQTEQVAGQGWEGVTAGVANFQVESSGTSSFGGIFSLRGLSNTPYFSDSAVGLYFDDIPLGSTFTYPADLFGFASVSIFTGPQGTVFGRPGEGGVVVLRLPQAGPAGGEVRVGAGNYDSSSVAFQAGGPAGPNADATVAAAYTDREGYIDNTQISQRVGGERAMTVVARGRLRPAPNSEISLEILGSRHRDGAQPLVPLGGPLYTVQRAREGETDTGLFGAALKAVIDTPAGRLTSVTSYTDWKLDPYDNWLVLPPPLESHLTQSQENWSEEIHLASDSGSAVSWSTGAWFSDSRTNGSADRSILGQIPIEVSNYRDNALDSAAFGEVVVPASADWRIELGLRAERASKDYFQDEEVPTAGLDYHFRRVEGFLLPKVGIAGNLASETTAHASLSLGSKSGGFSPYTDKAQLIPFAAERTAALEAGVDKSLYNNMMVISAGVFDYEIRNYQIERSFSSTDYLVATAPRARSLGADVEAQFRPSPAWTLGIVAGVADVKLLEFNDPLTGRSYAEKRAPYAPAGTADLSASYGAKGGYFGRVDLVARGRTFYTEAEDPVFSQGAYVLLNSRVGFEARRWRISVYMDNIAGRGYYTQIIPGVNSASPGAPRTFGSELALKF